MHRRSFGIFVQRKELVLGKPQVMDLRPSKKTEVGIETLTLPEYGRSADLLVMGRQRESKLTAMAVRDSAILETGRPVLLVPETAKLGQLGTLVHHCRIVTAKGIAQSDSRVLFTAPCLCHSQDEDAFGSLDQGDRVGHRPCRRDRSMRRTP